MSKESKPGSLGTLECTTCDSEDIGIQYYIKTTRLVTPCNNIDPNYLYAKWLKLLTQEERVFASKVVATRWFISFCLVS